MFHIFSFGYLYAAFGCGKGKIMEKAECIQLPPIERGTDSNLVKMYWEYVQLPPECRESVDTDLTWIDQAGLAASGEEKDVRVVAQGEIESFRKAMMDVIADIILETSQFACWLHHQIYDQGLTVEELLEAYPETRDLILVMSSVFKELKEKRQ